MGVREKEINEQDIKKIIGMAVLDFARLPEKKQEEMLGKSELFRILTPQQKTSLREMVKKGYQIYLESESSVSKNPTLSNVLGDRKLPPKGILQTAFVADACTGVIRSYYKEAPLGASEAELIESCQQDNAEAIILKYSSENKEVPPPKITPSGRYNFSTEAYAISEIGLELFEEGKYSDYMNFREAVKKDGMKGATQFLQQIGMPYAINQAMERAQIMINNVISRLDEIKMSKAQESGATNKDEERAKVITDQKVKSQEEDDELKEAKGKKPSKEKPKNIAEEDES